MGILEDFEGLGQHGRAHGILGGDGGFVASPACGLGGGGLVARPADLQCDRVLAGRLENDRRALAGTAQHVRQGPPAFLAQLDVVGVEGLGAELDLGGGLAGEVPPHPVHARLAGALERAHDLSGGVRDLDLHAVLGLLGEPIVDRGAVGRILAVGLVVEHGEGLRDGPEAVGGASGEEMRGSDGHLG